MKNTIIAVDFDGTIVEHCFPAIGKPVPGAFAVLKRLQEQDVKLILWTMRCDGEHSGPVLTQAVEFCRVNGLEFWAVNSNPQQGSWTKSPKAYAHIYIDDAAFGCPLIANGDGRPYVDWNAVEKILVSKGS